MISQRAKWTVWSVSVRLLSHYDLSAGSPCAYVHVLLKIHEPISRSVSLAHIFCNVISVSHLTKPSLFCCVLLGRFVALHAFALRVSVSFNYPALLRASAFCANGLWGLCLLSKEPLFALHWLRPSKICFRPAHCKNSSLRQQAVYMVQFLSWVAMLFGYFKLGWWMTSSVIETESLYVIYLLHQRAIEKLSVEATCLLKI